MRRGVDPAFLDRIRSELGLALPPSFLATSAFFDGSDAREFPIHDLSDTSPTNVISETKRLREAIDLPASLLVLAEPPESLVVLNCADGTVIWCDAFDAERLGKSPLLSPPDIWASYADFVEFVQRGDP